MNAAIITLGRVGWGSRVSVRGDVAGGGSASTPLAAVLRESCGYLRDADYHQTAQLMTVAADEIERLNRELRALDTSHQSETARAKAGQNPLAIVIGRVRSLARAVSAA